MCLPTLGVQSEASNYNPCQLQTMSGVNLSLMWCTDTNAVNYNSFANVLDESCLYTGCTDFTASNYNSQATIDDGSLLF